MAYTLQDSEPAMLIENQLFAVPASFTDRWRTEYEKVNPATVLSDDGSSGGVTFQLPPSSNGMLSLNDLYLELEVAIKVRTGITDWKYITDSDGVAPVNNFLHSLFQNVSIEMNGRTITDSSNYYAYRAYMDTMLTHTKASMDSVLTPSLFILDDFQKINDSSAASEIARKNVFIRVSDYVQLSGRLAADICDQPKPLLTGVGMSIRMVMSRPEFYLRVWDKDKTKQFKAFIRNPRLAVRRFVPSPDYLLSVTQQLQEKSVKYHIEREVMRITDIPKGTQSTVVSNLQIGQLPKVVYVGFVGSDDFNGNLAKNPFIFNHCNIRQISVEVDGQSYPTKPYQADFKKWQSLECYDGLMDTLGRRNTAHGEYLVHRDAYQCGFTIFGFDLTPGSTGRGPLTLIKQGNLSVALHLAEPLPENVIMVCLMVYDSILEINHHRQIIADFAT